IGEELGLCFSQPLRESDKRMIRFLELEKVFGRRARLLKKRFGLGIASKRGRSSIAVIRVPSAPIEYQRVVREARLEFTKQPIGRKIMAYRCCKRSSRGIVLFHDRAMHLHNRDIECFFIPSALGAWPFADLTLEQVGVF